MAICGRRRANGTIADSHSFLQSLHLNRKSATMNPVTLLRIWISGVLQRLSDRSSFAEEERALWTSSDWSRVRAPVRHRDMALSERATRWLGRLPTDVRPTELCQRFPRIVNRVAALWKDEGLTDYTLIELLAAERPGWSTMASRRRSSNQGLDALYELHLIRADAHPSGTPTDVRSRHRSELRRGHPRLHESP